MFRNLIILILLFVSLGASAQQKEANQFATDKHKKALPNDTIGNRMVKAYPNPVNNELNIDVIQENIATIKIEILGSMGERLRTYIHPNTPTGKNQFKVLLDGIREGNLYLTAYQDGNLIFAGMIIKVKQ